MCEKKQPKAVEQIFDRISSEMERQGRKQAELTEYLGLPRGTYTNWKLGRGRTFCEHLGDIADFLGVDIGWLVTGEIRSADIKDEREKELLELFRKLSKEKQNSILQNMKWLEE